VLSFGNQEFASRGSGRTVHFGRGGHRRAFGRRLGLGAMIAMTVTVAAGCGSSSGGDSHSATTAAAAATSSGNGTYTIGVINTVSGASGAVGEAEEQGVTFAVKQLNKEGGINGHHVAVNLLDDQGQPSQALVSLEHLTTSGHVPVVLGPGLTANAQAIAPKLASYQTPDITFSSDPAVVKGTSYAYEFVAPESFNGAAMVSYLKHRRITSAYLLSGTTPYGEAGEAGVRAAAKAAGIKILSSNTFTATATDFTAQASAVAAAKPPAVLMYASASTADGKILKALRSAGYNGLVVGDLGFALAYIPQIAGSATKNLVALSPLDYGATSGPAFKFIRAFKAAEGSVPSIITAYGYEAVNIAADAMKTAKSASPAAVQAGLKNMKYDGPLGTLNYGSTHLGPQTGSSYAAVQFSGSTLTAAP
jgi:branched-chain amino acid transport system substrate-binding protein